MKKTKKVEKQKTLKTACLGLNRILAIKDLSVENLVALINKLKKFVRNSKPGNVDVLKYVKFVVSETLTTEEKKSISDLLLSFNQNDPKEQIVIQNVLASIYNSITEIYPDLKVDIVCADLNGFLNVPTPDDKEFKEFVDRETKKNKKVKEPAYKLSSLKDINSLESFLQTNIIGQQEAVKETCNALKLKAAGFTKFLSLFFIGKTGVGKSQLAKLLGKRYSPNFWKIDCGEFSNGHEVNKLLGSPPGYIGHTTSSQMKERSDKSNKWVILFDEIEKANEKFFSFLLALTEDGICHDNNNNKIDFSDSIFIFTSNCGVRDLKTKTTNFHRSGSTDSTKEELLKSLEKDFPPEFRNRIDKFVFFNNLTKENAEDIVRLNLKEYPLKPTKDLIDYLVRKGFSEEFGARSIKRCIKDDVLIPLSEAILDSKVPQDGTTNYEVMIVGEKVKVINTVS